MRQSKTGRRYAFAVRDRRNLQYLKIKMNTLTLYLALFGAANAMPYEPEFPIGAKSLFGLIFVYHSGK